MIAIPAGTIRVGLTLTGRPRGGCQSAVTCLSPLCSALRRLNHPQSSQGASNQAWHTVSVTQSKQPETDMSGIQPSITALSSREVYRNAWMRVREDEILRSNGKRG